MSICRGLSPFTSKIAELPIGKASVSRVCGSASALLWCEIVPLPSAAVVAYSKVS